jgi:hypothetical protein
MILAHFLRADPAVLLSTLKRWPNDIYSYSAVVLAIEDRLERDGSAGLTAGATANGPVLMECLVELFLAHRQPGRALPYFLRLRRPGVFDLIRDHNLFTAVQDQALLLVQFEEELDEPKAPTSSQATLRPPAMARRTTSFRASHVEPVSSKHGAAIDLLVDHTHSIPVRQGRSSRRALKLTSLCRSTASSRSSASRRATCTSTSTPSSTGIRSSPSSSRTSKCVRPPSCLGLLLTLPNSRSSCTPITTTRS